MFETMRRPRFAGVSFDFFNTLVYHQDERGRGAHIREYFGRHGWPSDAWSPSVIDGAFAECADHGMPDNFANVDPSFRLRMTTALLQRMGVGLESHVAAEHAQSLWNILGPAHFSVFPDVEGTLRALRERGLRLMLISNWHAGLRGFCRALALDAHFDVIVSSFEAGFEKPDRRIFEVACTRLGLPAEQVLHIGDNEIDDVDGARAAGLGAVHLKRPECDLMSKIGESLGISLYSS
jgi:HAD superfamily hydrolase (TIGR01549 family)